MSESPSEAQGGLSRLPPGRHGLPRAFVAQNQRDRLAAGIIAAVSEHGYHEATISHIASAAGVSRRTFYTYFASKEECFVATYDQICDHLRETAAEPASNQREWPLKVKVSLGAALEAFAANPQLARFTLAIPPRAGGAVSDRYREALNEALEELTQGASTSNEQPSSAIQQSLIGGVVALIVAKVEAGEGERLQDLHPDLAELFLAPFIGRSDAARIAHDLAN